jgi:alkanesulfonate monooxygenase SsuD/methylene tetrahydromethanopterin reductase-like flavin-dependent oxidoreductase (luciferase family)
VAAVTERIGLATTVLLGPLRPNPVAVAKQVPSVHTLSGGRMTLGIGLGGREDDYEHAEVDTEGRGKDSTRCWRGSRRSGRATRWDRTPARSRGSSSAARSRSRSSARPNSATVGSPPAPRGEAPQNAAIAYFSLGDRAEEAQAYLTDYYAWLGDEVAGFIADSAAKDPDTVKQYLAASSRPAARSSFFFPARTIRRR